jgi:DNA-binding MarR family transcriptional regulator
MNAYLPKEPCICIGFRRIARKFTDFYDKYLQPAGIGANQFSLLVNIDRMEGCAIGELARKINLEKSTLVRTLQPLLRAELIVDKSQAKTRKRELYLTPAGKEVLQKALPLWTEAQENVKAKLGWRHDELVEIFKRIKSLG